MTTTETLDFIGKDFIEQIQKELRAQGHYFSGRLEESIRVRVKLAQPIEMTFFGKDYLEGLNEGIEPQNIENFDKNSKDYRDLLTWIIAHGLGTIKTADSIAFLIWRKWKKEGKPLPSAKIYSSTGENKNAVSIAWDKNEDRYTDLIDHMILDFYDA